MLTGERLLADCARALLVDHLESHLEDDVGVDRHLLGVLRPPHKLHERQSLPHGGALRRLEALLLRLLAMRHVPEHLGCDGLHSSSNVGHCG